MEITSRRRMNGMQREPIFREPPGQFVRALRRAVIEVPARAEQFDRGCSGARRFSHQSGRQFPIHKKIRGKYALHRHSVRALFIQANSTLSEAWNCVKASPRPCNGGMGNQNETWRPA